MVKIKRFGRTIVYLVSRYEIHGVMWIILNNSS